MALNGLIVRGLGGGTSTGSIALLISRGLIGAVATVRRRLLPLMGVGK